jgi:hypothetical protein
MAWTVDSSGTQTATIGTEHTLAAGSTTNATYVFHVRLNNLTYGDNVELRVYTMTLAAGSLELIWKSTHTHVPICTVVQSPPVPSDQSIKVSLKQTAGTGRSFDWKLLRV